MAATQEVFNKLFSCMFDDYKTQPVTETFAKWIEFKCFKIGLISHT